MGTKAKWIFAVGGSLLVGIFIFLISSIGSPTQALSSKQIILPKPEELGPAVPLKDTAAIAPSKEVSLKRSSGKALEVPSEELKRLEREKAVIY